MNTPSEQTTQAGLIRKLEAALYLELQKGTFCYVTMPLPRVHFSLCQRTCHAMEQRGYHSVVINFAEEQLGLACSWDYPVISALWNSFRTSGAASCIQQWLQTTASLSPLERLMQFVNDYLLLDLCEGPLMICLENIDALLTSPSILTELLTWIGHCFEIRDSYLTYHHLSFAAFGTALFSALIDATTEETVADTNLLSVFAEQVATFKILEMADQPLPRLSEAAATDVRVCV